MLNEFNEESKFVSAFSYNEDSFLREIANSVKGDVYLALYAVIVVVTYCSLFLGSFSPIHCRLTMAIVGVCCVFVSNLAGEGISYILGWKSSEFTEVLPILILGIGVDDMFVVCNAIDQTSLDLPAIERIKQGMKHAGPSITITSVTDAVAFFIGSTSSLLAIKSLCFMAGCMVICLYLSVLTIFLPILIWDTIRVNKKGRECFGACFC